MASSVSVSAGRRGRVRQLFGQQPRPTTSTRRSTWRPTSCSTRRFPSRSSRATRRARRRALVQVARCSRRSWPWSATRRVIYGDHPNSRVMPTRRGHRQGHARRAGRVPQGALRAGPGHRRHRRRHHAGRGAQEDRGHVRRRGRRRASRCRPCGTRRRSARSKVYLVDRANSVQTSLVVGTQAINRTSPDYDVVSLLNSIIGGGPTGPLVPQPARGEGLDLRRVQQPHARRGSGATGRPRPRSAATSPNRRVARDPERGEADAAASRSPTRSSLDKKRSLVASFALSLETPTRS